MTISSFHGRALGVLSCLLPLVPLAFASTAAAQDIAAAEALFNRGFADMSAGRYATACPAIAESERIDPRPGTLFTLAQCEVGWGRVATAMTRLGDYLDLYERLTPEQKGRQGERPKVAKEQREKLAADVPTLRLSLPEGAPPGTVVKRDDGVVAAAALGLDLPVDPGDHVVSTQAPGGPLWEQRILLGKGEKKALVLEVKSAPTAPPAVAEPLPPPLPAPTRPAALQPEAGPFEGDKGISGRRTAAYALGGVGIAGLVLGGVTGGLALGDKATIHSHCGGAIGSSDSHTCDPTGLDAASRVKTAGLVSTIGFGVGLAGVGAAAVLLLTDHKPAKSTTGGRGPSIVPEVLGATGGIMSVRARW